VDFAVAAVLGGFDGVLIAGPIAAGDGVVGVSVERVVGLDYAGG
jgi:hypothetical protein